MGLPFSRLGQINVCPSQVSPLPDNELDNLCTLSPVLDLDLSDRGHLSDASLDDVSQLTSLRRLNLLNCSMTQAGLEKLQELTNLTSLALGWDPPEPSRHNNLSLAFDYLTQKRWQLLSYGDRAGRRLASGDLLCALRTTQILGQLSDLSNQLNRPKYAEMYQLEKTCVRCIEEVMQILHSLFEHFDTTAHQKQVSDKILQLIAQVRTWESPPSKSPEEIASTFANCQLAAEKLLERVLPASAQPNQQLSDRIGQFFRLHFQVGLSWEQAPQCRNVDRALRVLHWEGFELTFPKFKEMLVHYEEAWNALPRLEQIPQINESKPLNWEVDACGWSAQQDGARARRDTTNALHSLGKRWSTALAQLVQLHHEHRPLMERELRALEPFVRLQELRLRNVHLENFTSYLTAFKRLRQLSIEKSNCVELQAHHLQRLPPKGHLRLEECTHVSGEIRALTGVSF